MVHRTMQGKEIDMEKLMNRNELMPAVGNIRVNARGDELGAGGSIIRKREDVVGAYYEGTTAAVNPRKQASAPTPVAATPVAEETIDEAIDDQAEE